jgi:hypothetical protein
MAGKPASFDRFRDLVQLLLGVTVLAAREFVTLVERRGAPGRVLGGRQGPTSPLQLRDGRWLRVAYSLYLEPQETGSPRLKVEQSSIQYQSDEEGQCEIFRYDYLRQDGAEHPSAHLNVHGALTQPDVLQPGRSLARVHFPTARVSLEAVLRLLITDFGVPSAEPEDVWKPVLAESEMTFQQIAHQPRPPGSF